MAEQGLNPSFDLGKHIDGQSDTSGNPIVEAAHRLHEELTTDQLTGLYNQEAFIENIEAARNEGKQLAIAYLDLRNFKSVNDQHPERHARGDQVLIDVASILRSVDARGGGLIVSRLGGDELAIAFELTRPDTSNGDRHDEKRVSAVGLTDQAENMRQRIEQSISQYAFDDTAVDGISLETLGFGGVVGLSVLGEDEEVAEAIHRADQEMFERKFEANIENFQQKDPITRFEILFSAQLLIDENSARIPEWVQHILERDPTVRRFKNVTHIKLDETVESIGHKTLEHVGLLDEAA